MNIGGNKMTKVGFILSKVTEVYSTKFIIFNTILSFSISWFYSKIIVEKSFNLFSISKYSK